MIHMIGKLDREEKADWPRYLPALIQAYNATRSAVMGYSPHYLLMGRRPRIPIDVTFPTLREKYHTTVKVHSYVHGLKRALKRAYSIAWSCTEAEAAWQKRYYDRRANTPILEPGDLVLLKIREYKGKRKVLDRWDNQPWKVVTQLDDGVPAYVVMDPRGATRVLHCNNLFLLETADSAAPLLAAFSSVENRCPNSHSNGSSSSEEESQEEEEIVASHESDEKSGILGLARMARYEWIWEGLHRAFPWAPEAAPD